MWRWSYALRPFCSHAIVFSTYVEMILALCKPTPVAVGILHVCGDDPVISPATISCIRYSPRMWRWSYRHEFQQNHGRVFSTYVEMILKQTSTIYCRNCILHVCGDDPNIVSSVLFIDLYSPRMWRWSWSWFYQMCGIWVFSTYVEMILKP